MGPGPRCALASFVMLLAGCATPPHAETATGAKPPPSGPYFMDVGETTFLVSRRSMSLERLQGEADAIVAELDRAASAAGLQRGGPLHMFYYGCSGDRAAAFDFEVGLPVVDPPPDPPTGFAWKKTAAFACLAARHVGSMADLRTEYASLYRRAWFAGRKPSGENREVYSRWEGFASSRTEAEIQVGLCPER